MESKQLLSTLIKLSRADNHFDEFEFAYILKVGRHIGVDDHIVEQLIKDSTTTELEIPKEEQDRMSILYYMLFLMKVDTIIHEDEIELIHHYGFKLGFSLSMIDEFIAVMHEHKFKKVPTDALLDIIKKYQN